MGFTELHRHLDATVRPATIVELCAKFGIEGFASEEDVKKKFWITDQMESLEEVLNRFHLFQDILLTCEILERVAFEAVEDAAGEGISEVEFRFSPAFVTKRSRLPWDDVLDAFKRGLKRGEEKFGIKSGLICIIGRGYENSVLDSLVDFIESSRDDLIGVDLAGFEAGFPSRLYESAFRRVRNLSLPVTVHAGEALGAQNIWESIDILGARRIGHGIAAIKDKALMRRMRDDKILIETCPTSNYVTRSVPSLEEHPLPKFLEAGVPVSVSTDDPGIFGVTLSHEHEICRRYMKLSDDDIKRIDDYAKGHTFLHVYPESAPKAELLQCGLQVL